jgi:hypothetical protein
MGRIAGCGVGGVVSKAVVDLIIRPGLFQLITILGWGSFQLMTQELGL